MAVRIAVLLFAGAVLNVLAGGANLKERERTCPSTFVNRDTKDCEIFGLIGNPDIISTSVQTNKKKCGAACLAAPDCESLSFDPKRNTCIIYRKTLKAMNTTHKKHHQRGFLFDRLCFSEDCNIIASCAATNYCDDVFYYPTPKVYYYYARYACSYGVTANQAHTNATLKEILYDGNLTACDVFHDCLQYLDYFDIHYYKPSQQWVCRETTELKKPGPRTYTLKNDSVGASYGYWLANTIRFD